VADRDAQGAGCDLGYGAGLDGHSDGRQAVAIHSIAAFQPVPDGALPGVFLESGVLLWLDVLALKIAVRPPLGAGAEQVDCLR
jgi:hypothetical protein